MEVVAIIVGIAFLLFLFSSGNSANNSTAGDVVRSGREQVHADEQRAQKARADAIAAHDAIFRNGPSDGKGTP